MPCFERLRGYISGRLLAAESWRPESESPTLGTLSPVRLHLIGVINEGFQHVGQAAYVCGLLKGRGWLGR